ncbi:MAG: hypothetical protein ACPL3C_01620, partial [Pyrobaculum sp.]
MSFSSSSPALHVVYRRTYNAAAESHLLSRLALFAVIYVVSPPLCANQEYAKPINPGTAAGMAQKLQMVKLAALAALAAAAVAAALGA